MLLRYPQMMEAQATLQVDDHRRDAAGLTYVYPVVSRRAGGVSVGINLNPNNACNWRCIYCQVPGLQRGAAPLIDVKLLDSELRGFLRELLQGEFMSRYVPAESRRINDIALSGNGEPTSAREFEMVIEVIARSMRDFDLLNGANRIKLVLITNGSLLDRPAVKRGVRQMAGLNGEVWFKFDRAGAAARRQVNNTRVTLDKIATKLEISAALCPTWIQTCVFRIDEQLPEAAERASYLSFLREMKERAVPLRGVLLYGLARTSLQPEARRLSAAPNDYLAELAREIDALGLPVRLHP